MRSLGRSVLAVLAPFVVVVHLGSALIALPVGDRPINPDLGGADVAPHIAVSVGGGVDGVPCDFACRLGERLTDQVGEVIGGEALQFGGLVIVEVDVDGSHLGEVGGHGKPFGHVRWDYLTRVILHYVSRETSWIKCVICHLLYPVVCWQVLNVGPAGQHTTPDARV